MDITYERLETLPECHQPNRAILTIIPCECECGHKWTEQEIITRNKTGYSYNLDTTTFDRLKNRSLLIEGSRIIARKVPLCYQCIRPQVSNFGWVDQPPEIKYFDPQTKEMKAAWDEKDNQPKRTVRPSKETEQAKINSLLKDL